MRPNLRQPPFRRSGEAVEHRARDRELEDAVAEELEPLVRLGAILGPRSMREHLLEPVFRQLPDQSAELVRPGVSTSLSPGAR